MWKGEFNQGLILEWKLMITHIIIKKKRKKKENEGDWLMNKLILSHSVCLTLLRTFPSFYLFMLHFLKQKKKKKKKS